MSFESPEGALTAPKDAHPSKINGLVYITILPPKDERGRFTDTGKYDEQQEEHIRQTAAVLAFYSEFGRNFDPSGRYLCGGKTGNGKGGCNKFRPEEDAKGGCVAVQETIGGDTGSCQFWENVFAGDYELEYPDAHKWTKEEAGYGERPESGEGFGCVRCEYAEPAKKNDSQGRSLWCGMHGARVRPLACCAKNERDGDIHFDGNEALSAEESEDE
jgi:hypothetical protein